MQTSSHKTLSYFFPRKPRPALALLVIGAAIACSVGCAVGDGGGVPTTANGGTPAVGGAGGEGGSVSGQAGAVTSIAGSSTGGHGGDAAGGTSGGSNNGGSHSAGASAGGASAGGASAGGVSAGGASAGGVSAGGVSAGGAAAGAASAGASAAGAGGSGGAPRQLAVGKNSTASTQEAGHEPSKGNDTDTTTRWCSTDGTFPQWWRVDLGAVHLLSQAAVRFEFPDRTYAYSIETSTNDSVYAVQKTVTGAAALQTVDFPANISARYVRITITSGTPVSINGVGTWASFFDFTVTGY